VGEASAAGAAAACVLQHHPARLQPASPCRQCSECGLGVLQGPGQQQRNHVRRASLAGVSLRRLHVDAGQCCSLWCWVENRCQVIIYASLRPLVRAQPSRGHPPARAAASAARGRSTPLQCVVRCSHQQRAGRCCLVKPPAAAGLPAAAPPR
jgi:hypothetical protein